MSKDSLFEDSKSSLDPQGELNGKDSSYRMAPLVSEPRLVVKQRVRGALVPMRRQTE